MIRQRKPIKRRSRLKPGKPPKRKTWVKRRRATPRRTAADRNEAYKAAVRKLPCVGQPDGTHADGCRRSAPSQASHVGLDKGMGTKAGDLSCVPHSDACHKFFERTGKVAKAARHAWIPGVVASTHAELERRGLYSFAPDAATTSGEGRVPW